MLASSKLCHRCGHEKEDLALHDITRCCPACGETHDRDVNASINLYFVGLGRPEVTPVEQALVDDRSPNGLPKKPSCAEAGSLTAKDYAVCHGLVYLSMFFANKVPIKVAKSIKMPLRAGTKAYNDMIIPYFRQFISGRQTAYLAQSSLGTLFFYKKHDVIVKYYLPNGRDWSEIFITPSAKNNDFMVHYSNTSESASKILPYHLIGVDYEPYKIIIEKVPLKSSDGSTFNYTDDDLETKIKIIKITTNEKVIEISLTGQVSIGYPLCNNYIPIVNLANKKFTVIILDIASKKVITFVKKWLKTITKAVGDYLEQIKKVDDWRQVNQRIIQGQYGNYKLSEVDFAIGNNYTITKCTFHVRNYTLYSAPIVFKIEIYIEKGIMHYKIIVPKQINITELGIDRIRDDYVVESQVLRLYLTDKEHTETNVLYQDTRYAILKLPSNEEKYCTVNSDGHIEHIIEGYVDCGRTKEPKYLFDIYFEHGFIIVLHKSGILLYDTLKGKWWQVEISNEENKIDFCDHTHEYYYIRKCKKLVFILLDKTADFDYCIMIDLKLIENDDKNYITMISEGYIRYREVIPYVKSTYGDFYPDTNVALHDYSLDANRGVLYVSYRLGNYTIKHVTMECNLCSNTYKWEEFKIDIPLHRHKEHIANTKTPVYISHKHLAMKKIPKYLPMYSLRSLYDIITNKIAHYGLVIKKRIEGVKIIERQHSSLEKRIPLISLYIIDASFNRNVMLFKKIDAFKSWCWDGKIFVMSPYQDIVGIYNSLESQMYNVIHTIGIMLINELVIVNDYRQK